MPALEVSRIAKTFGGARALKGIDFSVRGGEVHGLLGQNGCGKSTFVKILSGFHTPDPGGSITISGRAIDFPMRAGVFRDYQMAFVHQHLGLVPSLSVLENMRVASITALKGWIDWRSERLAAQAALNRFDIHLDLDARTSNISQIDRALLAIVRAADELRDADRRSGRHGILILDEPTPFLPREGVKRLFDLVRQVAAQGDSVVFISHDIDEVREITDRATILRDGLVSATLVTKDASHDDFVESIIGRRITRTTTLRDTVSQKPNKVIIENISEPDLQVPSIQIAEGEILGMTGLLGSGYERIPYLVFGASKASGGTLKLDGSIMPLASMTPKLAVACSMALLPSDRPKASGAMALSIADNMQILDLERYVGRFGLKRAQIAKRAAELSTQYEVRPNDPSLPLSALSGGNAQKVMLAKWLIRDPKFLMLDEPTQGVDVGTRQQVYEVIRKAATGGAAVLCASSDYEQLADLCTRILVLSRGRIVRELTGSDITKDNIAEACYGQSSIDAA